MSVHRAVPLPHATQGEAAARSTAEHRSTELHPVSSPNVDILALHASLNRALREEAGAPERAMALLELLVGLTNGAAGALFLTDMNGTLELGPRLFSKQAMAWSQDLDEQLRQAAEQSRSTRRVFIVDLPERRSAKIVAAPVMDGETARGSLCLLLVVESTELEAFVAILQLVAGYVLPSASRSVSLVDEGAAALVHTIHASRSQSEACASIVDEVAERLRCRKAALGLRQGSSGHCKLEAVSGSAGFDRRNHYVRSLTSAMDDCVLRDAPLHVERGVDSTAPGFASAARELCTLLDAQSVAVVPLRRSDDSPVGAAVLAWDTDGESTIERIDQAQALAIPVGAALGAMQQGFPGPIEARLRKLLQAARPFGAILACLMLLALLGVLMFPVPHIISADTVVQPMTRRFVATPFDSVLESSKVRPGDVVNAGSLLATLDGRELQWELAALTADLEKTKKTTDVNVAKGNAPAAQMARLEGERLNAQIELLTYRLDNLRIESPIDGLVLSGDLQREVGRPLSKGQRLFEIAPVEPVMVELEVPGEDIAFIEEGMGSEIRIEAFPDQNWSALVSRIRPKAALRDGRNVFVAEVTLENGDRKLRPGMRGRAKLTGDDRSLGWVLFHKAWDRLVGWLLW